jgi:hypothetical protein
MVWQNKKPGQIARAFLTLDAALKWKPSDYGLRRLIIKAKSIINIH